MKRCVFILTLLFSIVSVFAQRGTQSLYSRDNRDNLQYETRKGYKAILKTDIFGDKIYTDSRGNEIKYTKKFLERMSGYEEDLEFLLFRTLIADNERRDNYKETYSVDILGALQYEVKNGIRAELKTDISGSKIYTDNRGNEIEYTKKFLEKIPGYGSDMDELLFHSFVADNRENNNNREKYSVDIFGNIEYTGNGGRSATIEGDISDDIHYRDNQGVSAAIRKSIFGDFGYSYSKGKRAAVKKD